MDSSRPRRILVVANRTAAAPQLLDAIRRRRESGPCEFALLIPDVHNRKAADWTLDSALPILERKAGGPVKGLIGGPDAFASVEDAVRDGHFDEIIVSTLPKRSSKWLRRDLVGRIEGLGLPVTAITPGGKGMTNKQALKTMASVGARGGAPGGGAWPGGIGGG
jgi:hypothetical protein